MARIQNRVLHLFKSISFKLLRLAAAFLVAFVLAEVAMRLLGMGLPGRGPNNGLPLRRAVSPEVAPAVVEELIPGASGDVLYPGYGDVPDRSVHYAINADGFRDVVFARPKPTGVYRIALLGDSVVYGTGVNQADTLARQLEGLFADRLGARRVEVMNCGVYAYNLRQEVGLLKHRVLAFEPDMVMFVAAINDASGPGMERDAEAESWESRAIGWLGLASGVWEANDVQFAPPALQRMNGLRRHSVLIDRVAHVTFNALFARAKQKSYAADWAPDSPGRAAVRESLIAAKQMCGVRQIDLRVAMYPSLNGSLDADFDGHAETAVLRALSENLQIPFLDLFPALAGKDVEALRAHPHDRHPNRVAHGLVAHFLRDALMPMETTDLSPNHWRFMIPRPAQGEGAL